MTKFILNLLDTPPCLLACDPDSNRSGESTSAILETSSTGRSGYCVPHSISVADTEDALLEAGRGRNGLDELFKIILEFARMIYQK